MNHATEKDCQRLRELSATMSLHEAITTALGGLQFGHGVWRFFSDHYPVGGVGGWNKTSPWKEEWGIAPGRLYAFGEDVFGNQLIIRPNLDNTFLWNHENGEMVDMLLDPVSLTETVAASGLDWIDFYDDGSLVVARKKLLDVPLDCHLHWTTPLILGGSVTENNLSVVERTMHLRGHAKIWKQLQHISPGAAVAVKPSPDGK